MVSQAPGIHLLLTRRPLWINFSLSARSGLITWKSRGTCKYERVAAPYEQTTATGNSQHNNHANYIIKGKCAPGHIRFSCVKILFKILMEPAQTWRVGKCGVTSVRSTALSSSTRFQIYRRVGEVRCAMCKLLCKSVQGCKATLVSRVKLSWLRCRSTSASDPRAWIVTLLTKLQCPIEMRGIQNTCYFLSLYQSLSLIQLLGLSKFTVIFNQLLSSLANRHNRSLF